MSYRKEMQIKYACTYPIAKKGKTVQRRIQNENKILKNEPAHDKTNKMTCAPSEDSDQPGHHLNDWAEVVNVCSEQTYA